MPQMSPMWWLILMMNFIMCFMILNTMIFFIKKPIIGFKEKKTKQILFKWMW